MVGKLFMIKLVTYRVGVSPKLLIQNLINLTGLENGQIIIKVQNKRFIHFVLQPSLTPDEIDSSELINNELK